MQKQITFSVEVTLVSKQTFDITTLGNTPINDAIEMAFNELSKDNVVDFNVHVIKKEK